jgi:hypothetical protein
MTTDENKKVVAAAWLRHAISVRELTLRLGTRSD